MQKELARFPYCTSIFLKITDFSTPRFKHLSDWLVRSVIQVDSEVEFLTFLQNSVSIFFPGSGASSKHVGKSWGSFWQFGPSEVEQQWLRRSFIDDLLRKILVLIFIDDLLTKFCSEIFLSTYLKIQKQRFCHVPKEGLLKSYLAENLYLGQKMSLKRVA